MAIKLDKKRQAGLAANTRYLLVALVLVAAFVAAYSYATSVRGSTTASAFASGAAGAAGAAGATTASGGSTSGAGGSCCGGAGSSAAGAAGGCCGSGGGAQKPVRGTAAGSGSVQKVTIDLTTGSYSPDYITAKAGVPIELTFKGPASGCNGYVQSQQLGFSQDVSNGGTIKLPALKAGTYTWACSMNMYRAQIVVK